ncbi:glycosyltransferase [Lutibacter sp. B2]|nr:glycosyltransferase [Lutibacter sp. B2]
MFLSLCMIVKNAEKELGRCLESAKDIVDEMIIVDTGSMDHTVKIAKNYGAKVFYFKWNDNFSDARNFSLEKATGDWILVMDSDEEMVNCDRDQVNELLNNNKVDVYMFKSLSYVGHRPGLETMANMNIRLIRNYKGYKYSGALHEQLYDSINNDPLTKYSFGKEEIVIYHYGYLQDDSKQKQKSERNVKILNGMIKNDSENLFYMYNMGSEYFKLKKYKEALVCYEKAYKNFRPEIAYSPKLLIKMSAIYDELHMYDEQLNLLNKGIGSYNKFTDLEYIRACLFHKQRKYSLAIKGFKECIKMGEAPSILSNISGVEGYKSFYALGEIYMQLRDYDEAYKYYIEIIKAKPNFYNPLYRIADILFIKEKDISIIKSSLESFFSKNLNMGAYSKLGTIFFDKGRYDIALEYFLKVKEMMKNKQDSFFNIAMSYFYLKNYKEAYDYFDKIQEGEIYINSAFKMILCEIVNEDIINAEKLINRIKNIKGSHMDKVVVYEALKNLMGNSNCKIISDDLEESKKFTEIIFDLLTMILKAGTPKLFEKSLQLLNLIENDEVLLKLGKLYYNNGYSNLAYQEFIRSIKLFDKIDQEGLEMMRNIVDRPMPVTT